MYLPDHFKEVDTAAIAALIAEAPLGCIVAQTDQGLIANHIPLLIPNPKMPYDLDLNPMSNEKNL